MTHRLTNRRPPQDRVSSNAVIPATPVGVSSFLDRLSRMLKRSGFRAEESSEIREAVEQVLLLTAGQVDSSGGGPESHVFFTIGPTDFSIRIEHQRARFDPAILSFSGDFGSEAMAANSVLEVVGRLMDDIRCNSKGNAITLVRRRGVKRTSASKRGQIARHPQSQA
ncbi:MAG: hypothetical protein HYV60_10585 [Planctomycetia bacterium]|nr:hypothetical protein [Planctomycetia bacterium]